MRDAPDGRALRRPQRLLLLGLQGEPTSVIARAPSGAHTRVLHSKRSSTISGFVPTRSGGPQVPAPQVPAPQASVGGARNVQVIGTSWDTVAIVTGTSLGGQLGELMSSAPAVKVGSGTGRLLTTTLVNVVFLDDGRIAVGAVTPAALEAAIPAP